MLNRRIVNICQKGTCFYSATVCQKVSARKKHSEGKKNDSFVFNIFRGNVDTTQVLPYPRVLNGEQTELLQLLLDQAERVISQINDPLLNDELADKSELFTTEEQEMLEKMLERDLEKNFNAAVKSVQPRSTVEDLNTTTEN